MDNKKLQYEQISKDDFKLIQMDERMHDQKFESKPVSYFQDAFRRFCKNKSSVVASYILILIVIYALVAPYLSPYKISDVDGIYSRTRPKLSFFERKGFWDGGQKQLLNERFYLYMVAMGMAAEDVEGKNNVSFEDGLKSKYAPLISVKHLDQKEAEEAEKEESGEAAAKPKRGSKNDYYRARIDSYYQKGFVSVNLTVKQYEDIEAYEKETGIKILYPLINSKSKYIALQNRRDPNFWYATDRQGNPVNAKGKRLTIEQIKKDGFTDIYLRDKKGNAIFFKPKGHSMREARVLYYNYYTYKNGHEPIHILGSDGLGYDIWSRMAAGIRLSLLLSICVVIINMIVGVLIGAAEGFYGGWIDLLVERLTEILNGIPFIIVATLFQLHLVQKDKVAPFVGILFAFCLTGWTSIAYRVRTQFYRFKNQEYVMAARTLGARDARLMYKHILPNALGTIVTSMALIIPGIIMGEAVLSFLGIINLNSRNLTSLGTLISNAQKYLATDPHILFWPALIISLMMISFNLFGNGLRDAFNPSLRGAEE